MKSFFTWANKRMDYLSIWDIANLKWGCVAFGILLATLFPETLLEMGWLFWLILTIIFLIKPVKSFYFRKEKRK